MEEDAAQDDQNGEESSSEDDYRKLHGQVNAAEG